MTARRAGSLLLVALVVLGCASTVVPTMPTVATSMTSSFQGRAMTFTVAPWPIDETVAFLCRARPGPEFTPDAPVPVDAAGCLPLEVSTASDTLVATFDAESLDPAIADELARAGPPWFLAVAGSRGPFSTATVLEVINSPLFSPPGPS